MVDRWKLDGSFQPVLARDVRMYGFIVQADPTYVVDMYLNAPGHPSVRYEPAYPVVLVTFSQLGRVAAEDPPYRDVGWASETEATVWVFAKRTGGGASSVVWFAPYIFVDLPFAISQGREIYGFAKEIGRFDQPPAGEWHARPPDGPHVDRFTLHTFGTPRFDPATQFTMQPLLDIRRVTPAGSVLATLWSDIRNAAGELRDAVLGAFEGHPFTLEPPLEHLLPPIGTLVFLKQFWDARDGRFACYQALVEADMALVDPLHFRGWPLGGGYELTVTTLASHPLHRDLGWKAAQTTFPCLFAYWTDMTFRLGTGREVAP
jgi:hypothetical protein